MRVILQRVAQASVAVSGETVARIDRGLLLLVGAEAGDTETDIAWLVQKIARLRIFDDEAGVMNHALLDVGLDVLAVSQFTLFASTRKGNRPSWSRAAPAPISQPLFAQFVATLAQAIGKPVPTGVFGADMQVSLINDGPITLFLDSKAPE